MELHKMYHENGINYFKAGTKITNDKLETVFIDTVDHKAFKIMLNKDIFEESANNIGNNPEDIKSWAKKAFSSLTKTPEFTFSISESKEKLIWKKAGKRKLRIAEVSLEQVDYNEVDKKLFEHALNEKEHSARYKENYEKIAEERKTYMNQMTEMVKLKNNLEQDLYGHFLPILNSKQERIKELEDRIKDLEKKTVDNEQMKTAPRVVHQLSESSDDDIEIMPENESPSLLEENQPNSSMNFNNSQNLLDL